MTRWQDDKMASDPPWLGPFILSSGHLAILSFSLLLLGCVQRPAESTISAGVRAREDKAEVVATTDGAAVMVTNPRGIGSVRIGRQGPQWPPLLAVRLVYSAEKEFLNLHTLTIRAAGEAADAAGMEGRTGGLGSRDVLFFTGAGAGGYRGSYRIDIEHRARYLQITLPPELLKKAGDTIELSWVDQM